MNEKLNQKTEKNNFPVDSKWLKLINEINKSSPTFGDITLKLTFHESALARASILDRTQTIVFK
jgi:hypothetical protein